MRDSWVRRYIRILRYYVDTTMGPPFLDLLDDNDTLQAIRSLCFGANLSIKCMNALLKVLRGVASTSEDSETAMKNIASVEFDLEHCHVSLPGEGNTFALQLIAEVRVLYNARI